MSAPCPGCGLALPPHDGPTHSYIGASAACWALFGQVLAREYADPAYFAVHRLSVDAYAAQHPGEPGRRQVQSVWAHLVGLHLSLDRGLPAGAITRALGQVAGPLADGLAWLEPPPARGALTVADVLPAADAASHKAAVTAWARAVWAAWACHGGAVAALSAKAAA